jgi:hypothetical protein
MPGQQGVRRHDRGDVPQHVPSKCLGFRRQTTTLIVREPQTSGADLLAQGADLLLEIVDDSALLVHPTDECDKNEPQRTRQRGHGAQGTRARSSTTWRPI